MPNIWEPKFGLDKDYFWDKFEDFDNDGLLNSIEYGSGTNPMKFDSDGNGISDRDQFGFPLIKVDLLVSGEMRNSLIIPFLFTLFLFSIISIFGIKLFFSRKNKEKFSSDFFLQLAEPTNVRNLRILYNKVPNSILNFLNTTESRNR